jgi:hypothetical protein
MKKPFYTKRRLLAVKNALKANPKLKHGGETDLELHDFLIALAENIADKHSDDRKAALHYIIRNMGAVVQEFAEEAYAPHGYKNPFANGSIDSPPKAQWSFPIINLPPANSVGVFKQSFRQYSALKMFGYTVGKTAGWSEEKRHRFLSAFMELELPSLVEQTFGDDYGGPMTTNRLRKVANVIAANANNLSECKVELRMD